MKQFLILLALISLVLTACVGRPTPKLKGKFTGVNSHKPLPGAAIILCLVVSDRKCSLQANLVTVANKEGMFELTQVPPASYVIFYDPSGEAKSGWSNLDGLEISLKLEGLYEYAPERTELFSTFGGGEAISVAKGSTLNFSINGSVIDFSGDGSITSEKYGLTMDFHEGKPITVEIQVGKITEIEIEAFGQ